MPSRRLRSVTRDTRLVEMEREALLAVVEADFRQHGAAAIEQLRAESAGEYLRLVAALHPAEIKSIVQRQAPPDFSDEELRALLWQELAEDGIGPERLAEITDRWADFFAAFTGTVAWAKLTDGCRIPAPPRNRRADA